jgi:hypothetical protein
LHSEYSNSSEEVTDTGRVSVVWFHGEVAHH